MIEIQAPKLGIFQGDVISELRSSWFETWTFSTYSCEKESLPLPLIVKASSRPTVLAEALNKHFLRNAIHSFVHFFFQFPKLY